MAGEAGELRVGDLISVPATPAVVSLTDIGELRDRLDGGSAQAGEAAPLLSRYCLDDPDTRAAFEIIASSLARTGGAGDAFHVQGVYGSGKSHLLAALTLLAGSPGLAWPAFLEAHPGCEHLAADAARPRLVASIALDEYPTQSHPLEHVVLSAIERELAERHGVRAALTEQSHLLDLVDRYVAPQVGEALDEAAQEAVGRGWAELRAGDQERAAAVAMAFIEGRRFPLDWRRSRGEAWSELQRVLRAKGLDGVVVVLDELGLFLAGKDRRRLSEDASFLQWLAQRTAAARCWLVCATQRGLEEVGDIDQRTVRQLRDRFRSGLTLDLAELEWVVRHTVAPRRDPDTFEQVAGELAACYQEVTGEEVVTAGELAATYPLNPLCLQALRRAAERCLSRTRSAVRLLQEATREAGWLGLPARRLITPDIVFDVFRSEMAMTLSGRKHLDALEAVEANAARIARGSESRVVRVMKALCLLGLGEVRWSERELRASLVGCEDEELWRDGRALRSALDALYERGVRVERVRRDDGDEHFVDVSSGVPERVRQRLSELRAELGTADTRVLRSALRACGEAAFPIASLAEGRTLGVMWMNARRHVLAGCADLRELSRAELEQRAAALAAPLTREDGCLLLASPTADPGEQEAAWRGLCDSLEQRFAVAVAAWMPGPLRDEDRELLVEHAALALMVGDRTLGRRGGGELRRRVTERWVASEGRVKSALQRAYYEGCVLAADGEEAVERERLWGLFGDWEETLAAVFDRAFRRLFPRFASVAPRQKLVGRVHTNQVVDQFIRPGSVTLPPASALEAHLIAYADPLGLVEARGREMRLASGDPELMQAAVAAAPERGSEEIAPDETLRFAELAGRLGKSEWGLTREQAEVAVAALMRTGRLVGLDAFLEPIRLDQVASPLSESVPYVMRGVALEGRAAEGARALWAAASGEAAAEWDLPAQERAWGFLCEWAARLREDGAGRAEAITRAAVSLGHGLQEWDWAREALARAEVLAGEVNPRRTSREGLLAAIAAADRLLGGIEETCRLVADWQSCDSFLGDPAEEMAELKRLLAEVKVAPKDGLLARDREAVLAQIGSPERVVRATTEVKAAAARWMVSYRRHYLAWHGRVHAARRFEPVAEVGRSAAAEVARRLAKVGLGAEETAALAAELAGELGRRCLAGDPLPEGRVVCPACGVQLGEELCLPDGEALSRQVEAVIASQWQALAGQRELLERRLGGCADERVRARAAEVAGLLAGDPSTGDAPAPERLCELLDEGVAAWIREQLGRPRARRREMAALAERLRGRELPRDQVMRIVAEWLGEGEGFVEVV